MPFENEELELGADENFEKVDSGGRLTPGVYLGVLTDVTENEKDTKAFDFTVKGGPYDGMKVKYFLPDFHAVYDDKKKDKARQRVNMMASRLGLISKDDVERKQKDPSHRIVVESWLNAIGREFWLECERDQGGFVAPTYSGVYPPGHEGLTSLKKKWKLPDNFFGSGGATGGGGAGAGAATQQQAGQSPGQQQPPPGNKYANVI